MVIVFVGGEESGGRRCVQSAGVHGFHSGKHTHQRRCRPWRVLKRGLPQSGGMWGGGSWTRKKCTRKSLLTWGGPAGVGFNELDFRSSWFDSNESLSSDGAPSPLVGFLGFVSLRGSSWQYIQRVKRDFFGHLWFRQRFMVNTRNWRFMFRLGILSKMRFSALLFAGAQKLSSTKFCNIEWLSRLGRKNKEKECKLKSLHDTKKSKMYYLFLSTVLSR